MALLKITEIFAYVLEMCCDQIIGKRANRWISKWRVKENKAYQISPPKNKHFLPPNMHTYEVNVRFPENLVYFVFL